MVLEEMPGGVKGFQQILRKILQKAALCCLAQGNLWLLFAYGQLLPRCLGRGKEL
jgi:hypothetical protein